MRRLLPLLLLPLLACSAPPSATPDAGTLPDAGTTPPDAGTTLPDAGHEPTALEQFLDAWSAAWCAHAERCGIFPFDQPELCVAYMRARSEGVTGFNTMHAIVRAAERGELRFDPAGAEACLQGTRETADCDLDGFEDVPACAAALTGLLSDGAPCTADVACTGGLCFATNEAACEATCATRGVRCHTGSDCTPDERCDEGTCTRLELPPGAEGEPCGTDHSCQPGLGCLGGGDAARGVCRAPGKEGDSCSEVPCRMDLLCDESTQRCVPPPTVAEGGRCTGGECAPGLLCAPGQTWGTGTCLPARTKGEACTSLFQCGGLFSPWLCVGGRCVDRPTSGPCRGGDTTLQMLSCDLVEGACDFFTRQCVRAPRPGEPCLATGQCGGFLLSQEVGCDQDTGLCVGGRGECGG